MPCLTHSIALGPFSLITLMSHGSCTHKSGLGQEVLSRINFYSQPINFYSLQQKITQERHTKAGPLLISASGRRKVAIVRSEKPYAHYPVPSGESVE